MVPSANIDMCPLALAHFLHLEMTAMGPGDGQAGFGSRNLARNMDVVGRICLLMPQPHEALPCVSSLQVLLGVK